MDILAQIIGLIASIIMIVAIQVKDKKKLYLILNILVKVLYGFNFLLLNAYSGTITQIIGLVITIVAYIYTKKDLNIPKYLTFAFIVVTLIGGIFTYNNIYNLMAICCGITYALIVTCKNMKTIRKLNLLQSLLWTIYDLIINAYTASISSAFVFISTVIAIFRYDILKRNKSKYNEII